MFFGPQGEYLLFDLYSGGIHGFSMRKLRKGYSGPCIRVRRSSDNTEEDIGFLSGVLDTSALTSFVGANDGFIRTWYNQSDDGTYGIYDFEQATTTLQPKIVSSGSVITENGLPCIDFTDTGKKLICGSGTMLPSIYSNFYIGTISLVNFPFLGDDSQNNIHFRKQSTTQLRFRHGGGTTITTTGQPTSNVQHLFSIFRYDASNFHIYIDNVSKADTGLSGDWSSTLTIGYTNGTYQEIIVFTGDKRSDLSAIHLDINTFYSTY